MYFITITRRTHQYCWGEIGGIQIINKLTQATPRYRVLTFSIEVLLYQND
jgi:hypothetical protein